jgi:hypothetical protein
MTFTLHTLMKRVYQRCRSIVTIRLYLEEYFLAVLSLFHLVSRLRYRRQLEAIYFPLLTNVSLLSISPMAAPVAPPLRYPNFLPKAVLPSSRRAEIAMLMPRPSRDVGK